MKGDYNAPGCNSDQRPDIVVRGDSGPRALWFRPRDAQAPRDYDISVPHRTRKGWVVYIAFLGILLCVVMCIVPRMIL
jgi:hypothetical protein